MPRRIYMDNAATSFPKPPGVYEAMLDYGQRIGGTAGRGTYLEAREGAKLIWHCRERIAALVGAPDPGQVVFTLNTTDALNLAIKGVVAHRRGEEPDRPVHIVASELEHNSILRVLNRLAGDGAVQWTCVPADESGRIAAAAVGAALRPDTALVCLTHASNVTGVVNPVDEVGALCRARGVLLLVDAAQSAGHIPVDATAIDLLALPGHKGLLGPLGTGALVIRPGVERALEPLREGGTGSRSEEEVQPRHMPDRYEPGSQNAVGIVGLSQAMGWILERREELDRHERSLREAMLEGLAGLDALGEGFGSLGLRLLGPATVDGRVGIFSLLHETLSSHELAVVMEGPHGILGRAGLHCAPRAHGLLGTSRRGGAFRLSMGPFVSREDVRRACRALGEVCRAAVSAVQ